MAKIKFDIKYRPQIESGKYKVVERSTNRECTFLSKDDLVIVYFNGIAYVFDYEKSIFRCQMGFGEFDILTDEPELTKFEMQYAAYRYGSQAVEMFGQEQIEAVRKEWAAILFIARGELQGDMPHWNHIDAGCAGNGDIPPVYLVKDQYGCYALTTTVVGGDDYLLLSELDKLPKNYEQIQLSQQTLRKV